jgi:hypothetical protein
MRTRLSSPAVATCAPAGLTSIARIEFPACTSRLPAQLSLNQPHQSHAEELVTRARAQLASMSPRGVISYHRHRVDTFCLSVSRLRLRNVFLWGQWWQCSRTSDTGLPRNRPDVTCQ